MTEDRRPPTNSTSSPGNLDNPVIHVLYRYAATAGNNKLRPSYFSKRLALESFLDALAAAADEVTVTFLVDGEVGEDAYAAMRSAGEITRGSWHSNRRSYLAQLRFARATSAELVWFAEDDYLYARDSLTSLAQAVRHFPAVDWFALSGPTPLERLELRRAQSAVPLPRSRHWSSDTGCREVGGRAWQRIDSTTSTFGGRPAALRSRSWLLALCPWSGAAWDRTTCLAIQGATPYPWRHLLSDLLPASTPRARLAARVLWRVVTRAVVNGAALTQRKGEAVLIAPVTPLVGHMDLPYEERPAVWDARAAELAHRAGTSDSGTNDSGTDNFGTNNTETSAMRESSV